jgi:hypothetical protein
MLAIGKHLENVGYCWNAKNYLSLSTSRSQNINLKGQIFDTCHISVTRVSALKSLKVVPNTNIFFSSKCLSAAETCVTEI